MKDETLIPILVRYERDLRALQEKYVQEVKDAGKKEGTIVDDKTARSSLRIVLASMFGPI